MRAAVLLLLPFIISGLCLTSGSAKGWKTECHPTIVDLAVDVLDDDGYTYLVTYLIDSENLGRIKKAITDCDRLDLALNHYYSPITGQGLAGATAADEVAQTFFDKAVGYYESGDVSTAWYYFGWSLHVVQDLFVPFHSNLDPVNGHGQFEQFVYDYRFFYPPPANGTYRVSSNASQWVDYAATVSYPYYDGVSGANATDANFDIAATVLFPAAIGLTAGYIKFFADEIGLGDFSVYTLHRGLNYVKVGWDEVLDEDFVSYELYVSLTKDEIYSEDPHAVIYDRGMTEKTITGLNLGTDYYVRVRAVANASVHASNMLKVSPQWPLVFLLVPVVTTLAAVVILISKKHRRPRRVKT